MVNTPPSPDPSDILVVIPTLNEAAYIAGTLSQIIEHDPVAAVCPVIVADGGSTDSTQNIVK
ncbi:MAG: glycosyltransferase, partial [Pseudomonadota bacterium]